MKPIPAVTSLFPLRAAVVRRCLRLTAAILCPAAFFIALPAHGQVPITVPNFSFESPTTADVTAYAWLTPFPSWQMPPVPANFAGTNQGFTWTELTGVFLNTPAGQSDSITNINGTQAAWIFSDEDAGLYQTLTNTYQVGTSYSMTVGIVGGIDAGLIDGAIIQIQFFYLDANNNMVVIATTTATENSTNFPVHNLEYDYTVSTPIVQATDPWANQPIGIMLVSPATDPSLLGGYWDVDNVRLNSFPPAVPTPGLPGLLACGGGLLSLRGWMRNLLRRTR